jgi:sporulation protein YlmC with PRC-barrel domain
MKLYAIRRRDGWTCSESLNATAEVSVRIGDEEMSDQVRWIRSYVLREENGDLGTLCIYEAVNQDAIREHAKRVKMPADEIAEVVDTVIIRPDPVKTVAAR